MNLTSMVINGMVAVLSVTAWLLMVWGVGDPNGLAERGWRSLKYFTVLSNLLSGLACALCVAWYAGGGPVLPQWLLSLKLMSTAAVTLTFLTVLLFLGPTLGWEGMYAGGNFFMHLVLPLLAVVDCLLFTPVCSVSAWSTAWASVPPVLYAAWYASTVRAHGTEAGGVTYDFYGFLRWGWSKVPALIAGMICTTWAIARALWFGSKALCLA